MANPPPIPILPSVSALAGSCDAWISDIWGVLHNGVAAFPAASAACQRFRRGGGVIVLLSNAPRPAPSVIAQLDGLGVPRAAYDGIVTSGDLTRRLIGAEKSPRVFHIGPDRDRAIFDGLGVALVEEAEARLVVCSGLWNDDTETPDDYRALLTRLAARKLPMICGNPDIVVERGPQLVYCAGALAEVYEAVGGKVVYAGKPYLPAYKMAFEAIATAAGRKVPRQRILAIGDGLKTDIKGAAAAGLRSLFIASALHVNGAFNAAVLAKLFKQHPAPPIAAQKALVW